MEGDRRVALACVGVASLQPPAMGTSRCGDSDEKTQMCLGPRREENFEAGRRQRRPQGRPPRPQGLLIDDRQMQFARFLLASRLLGACALASCWGRGPLLLEGFSGLPGGLFFSGPPAPPGVLQGFCRGLCRVLQGLRKVVAWSLHGEFCMVFVSGPLRGLLLAMGLRGGIDVAALARAGRRSEARPAATFRHHIESRRPALHAAESEEARIVSERGPGGAARPNRPEPRRGAPVAVPSRGAGPGRASCR